MTSFEKHGCEGGINEPMVVKHDNVISSDLSYMNQC